MRLFPRLRSLFFWRGGYPFAVLLSKLLWPRATAGVVVLEDDRLLAVDAGSYLMLPIGGLAYAESFREAAEREALEEAGARVTVRERCYEGHNAYGGVEVLFSASLDGEHPEPTVTGDPVWVPVDEIPAHRWRFDRDVAGLVAAVDDA